MRDNDLILYHYPASPYAEKVRLLAGYLGLAWCSVEVPIQPPRQVLSLVAGGYRRIPVAQIGADVFCDTAIIAAEMVSRSSIKLAPCDERAAALAENAENAVFFAAIRQNSQIKTALGLILKLGFKGMMAFAKDRATFAVGHEPAMQTPSQAKAIFDSFLQDLDNRLKAVAFIGGESPCMSDFRCYHPLFLAVAFKSVKAARIPANVKHWMDRMDAFGWGQVSEISDTDAIMAAKTQSPRPIDAAVGAHDSLEEWVTVTPLDTGKVPVTGALVGQDADRIVVARRSDDVGLVHVHFPAAGFDCQKIN